MKGDPLECGNFRGFKLLEHRMKMFENILERRLRKVITVNKLQLGFSSWTDTPDAVFIIQQLQEKHLEVHKDLFFEFVDLDNAYDRVPRDRERCSKKASEATRSNITRNINSCENQAWHN